MHIRAQVSYTDIACLLNRTSFGMKPLTQIVFLWMWQRYWHPMSKLTCHSFFFLAFLNFKNSRKILISSPQLCQQKLACWLSWTRAIATTNVSLLWLFWFICVWLVCCCLPLLYLLFPLSGFFSMASKIIAKMLPNPSPIAVTLSFRLNYAYQCA